MKKRLDPGVYVLKPRLRLHLPPDYDRSRLKLTLAINADGKNVALIPLSWPLFDSRAGAFTEFEHRLAFTIPATLEVELSWSIAPLATGEKPRAVRPVKGPTIDDTARKFDAPGSKKSAQQLADLVGELQADVATPLAGITYPAVLIDRMEVSAETTSLAVEKVWPQKIHVYPGEANPIEVTARNFSTHPEEATVRLQIRTGLNESSEPLEATITVPAGSTAQHRFDWTAGPRELLGNPGRDPAPSGTAGALGGRLQIAGHRGRTSPACFRAAARQHDRRRRHRALPPRRAGGRASSARSAPAGPPLSTRLRKRRITSCAGYRPGRHRDEEKPHRCRPPAQRHARKSARQCRSSPGESVARISPGRVGGGRSRGCGMDVARHGAVGDGFSACYVAAAHESTGWDHLTAGRCADQQQSPDVCPVRVPICVIGGRHFRYSLVGE